MGSQPLVNPSHLPTKNGKRKERSRELSGCIKHEEPVVANTCSRKCLGSSRARFKEKRREKKRKRRERDETCTQTAPEDWIGSTRPTSFTRLDIAFHREGRNPIDHSCWPSNTSQIAGSKKPEKPKTCRNNSQSPSALTLATHSITGPYQHQSIDDLTITTMRASSPQLETLASPKSPAHIKTATSLLILLRSRAARLQTQIFTLETELQNSEALHTPPESPTPNRTIRWTKTLEAMLELASEHWHDAFILEYSLRDVVDEESSATLAEQLECIMRGFEELVGNYDEKLWDVMVEGCEEAVEETVRGIVSL
ncbi:hypothetical protein K458DRAFT_389907 [Lentithecium fluviatile CBS 122367]|uniref:Uncharacterized protein n=1 Tax=Lentithecium fluviatile CBS 122367 TaxID=1168545 RepID=A0A6G1IZD4_9PLEO|nr:hypothetical protein K458DRAFT_389907 [Lentithecium fluviatile CBS 122367]